MDNKSCKTGSCGIPFKKAGKKAFLPLPICPGVLLWIVVGAGFLIYEYLIK
ncbi:hypothetical protein [Bacillus sp. 1P06AnD]|uniref:hypothetical protein n=1 Tax=Bacillus sp. 1P06AnD TaxID=3132208 RepID=UPI0039A192D0